LDLAGQVLPELDNGYRMGIYKLYC